jgi:hypothetical protein
MDYRRAAVAFEIPRGRRRDRSEETFAEVTEIRLANEAAAERPWSALPVLPYPGDERPTGREGAPTDDDATLLNDGSVFSGRVSLDQPSHRYRISRAPNEGVLVQLFARCVEAPCRASVGAGPRGAVPVEPLHRNPPAWSSRRAIVPNDDLLEASCGDSCADGASEFFGTVHVVRETPIYPDEE